MILSEGEIKSDSIVITNVSVSFDGMPDKLFNFFQWNRVNINGGKASDGTCICYYSDNKAYFIYVINKVYASKPSNL